MFSQAARLRVPMHPFKATPRRVQTSLIFRYQIPTRPSLSLPAFQRKYSAVASPIEGFLSTVPDLDASKLIVTKTKTPKELLPKETLKFGHSFTDHMLTVEWNESTGWLVPQIKPYEDLTLNPAMCVFHYGFECFEGMKALPRPDRNMDRLNSSSARIALPTFNPDQLVELIKSLVKVDQRFIPDARGYSLYLRTVIIGTQATLGIGSPGSALLFLIASPVGPYYPTGFKAVSLEATSDAVRAWPGGVGNKKLGANYAPCIVPQREAAKRGHQQNLWLFGEDENVTEVGPMNFFAVIKDQNGQKELATPPLDGTILEGVTRESILALARERLVPEGWKISERYCTMPELALAADEGRFVEAFGSGTAAVVSPIRSIAWRDRVVDCGLKADEEAGKTSTRIKKWIEEIQYGEINHPWSVSF